MQELTLKQLIDPQVLQKIQDGFAKLTGMAALTADANGVPVTEGSNFTEFCSKLTRKSSLGCKLCEECDKNGGLETRRAGMATSYFCHAGLVDFAAPIMLDGNFIGSFIGGQVLTEEPDEKQYREIAHKLDIDEDTFVDALHKVSIVPKEKVQSAAEFLYTIAEVLSTIAYTSYNMTQMNADLISSIEDTTKIVGNVHKLSEQAQRSISKMGTRFDELSALSAKCMDEVEGCTDIVNVIQDSATTTHILGLNASIEASRAKEDGKGFGVIAREVRGLADTSRQSADLMKSKINNIHEHAKEIADSAAEAKQMVSDCLKEIDVLKESVAQIHGGNFNF